MKERVTVQTSLLGIAKKARSDKRYRFRNLYRELNEELPGSEKSVACVKRDTTELWEAQMYPARAGR